MAQAIAAARTETGRRRYREVMVSDAPPPVTPYLDKGVVDSVFGELWDRPGLARRDRRWVTLACVAAAAVDEPIQQHVYAALASGDITREEFQEFVLHFAYYAGLATRVGARDGVLPGHRPHRRRRRRTAAGRTASAPCRSPRSRS